MAPWRAHAGGAILKNLPLVLIAVRFGAVLGFATSGGCQMQSRKPQDPHENVQELGRQVGLALPQTARLLGVERARGGPDAAVLMKVEMAVGEWQRAMTAAPFKASELSVDNRDELGADHDWWDPSRPSTLKAIQKQLPNGRFLNVGVDEVSRPGKVVVYIMNFST
jgi:hypothetical protein